MTAVVRRTLRCAGIALLVLLALELMLPALVRGQEIEGIGTAVPSYGVLDWLSLGFRLALVVGAIYLAVLAMRWYVRRVNGDGGRLGRQVQVLESRALGPNRSLHLVRLGGHAVLLGVTAERISPLITIEDAAEVERLVEAATTPVVSPLQKVAGGVSGFASLGLGRITRGAAPAKRAARSAEQRSLLVRALEWLNPMPPKRTRPQFGAAGAAARMPQMPMPQPVAAQRVRAANAYGRESALAAAQRAIAEAQGGAGR